MFTRKLCILSHFRTQSQNSLCLHFKHVKAGARENITTKISVSLYLNNIIFKSIILKYKYCHLEHIFAEINKIP